MELISGKLHTLIQPGILDVKQKLREGWTRKEVKRTEIHVSDLLYCKRQKCFERIDDNTNPRPIDNKKLMYFFGGQSLHRGIAEILGDEFEYEKEIVWNGDGGIDIIGHPDAIWKQDHVIVEVKSTTSAGVLKKPFKNHVRQISAYIAMTGAPYGKLFYIILGQPDIKNPFQEYLISLTNEEREKILTDLENDALELQRGIDSKSPENVSHIAFDKSYKNKLGFNWLCAECVFYDRCLEMIAKDGEPAKPLVQISGHIFGTEYT